MARFTSVVDVEAPLERVWQRITDWPRHGRWIPFTVVTVTSERPDGVGARFVGRSGLGPIGFDDPMEVTEWQPPSAGLPGHCRVRKEGRVLAGWAAVDVEPRAAGGSTVRWTEDVQPAVGWLARLLRPADRVIAVAARAGFDRALRAMAAELEQEVRAGG